MAAESPASRPALGDELVFGQRIRHLRVFTLHLSQREFAAAAGVDHVTLSKVEAGHVKPWDEATIRRVAGVLDDDADELLALVRQWRPPDPATLESVAVYAPHPRFCIVCGRDMRDQTVYHETGSGRAVCVEHLGDPARYWTGEGVENEKRMRFVVDRNVGCSRVWGIEWTHHASMRCLRFHWGTLEARLVLNGGRPPYLS